MANLSSNPTEDDLYEDTGELAFPIEPPDIWLVRLPKWLWSALAEAGDEDEVHIGKIRVWDADRSSGSKQQTMRLMLSQDWQKIAETPKIFNLEVTNMNPINTYIFSEKDMAGYKLNSVGRSRLNHSLHVLGNGRSGNYRAKRYRNKARRAVPKYTALFSRGVHEMSCKPVNNDEYRRFNGNSIREALRGKHAHTLAEHDLHKHTSNVPNKDPFAGWIPTTENKNRREPLNKAARIPEAELIKLLFSCFQEYKFWHTRTLRHRTQQPEAYLRQVLSNIAVLSKSGQSSGTWRLREEHQIDKYIANVKEEIAPEEVGGSDIEEIDAAGDEAEDDENDTGEMEDVLLV